MVEAAAEGEAEVSQRNDSIQQDPSLSSLKKLIERASCLIPPSNIQTPVGGILQRHLPVWSFLEAPQAILNIVRDGYALPFRTKPPTVTEPIFLKAGNQPEIKKQVVKLLEKAAIEPVLNTNSPGFYSRLFVVPKSNGGYRPVIDLSEITKYLRVPKFRMETPASIKTALQGSRWAGTVDLSDAYFHIPMHIQARSFLRFGVDGQVWQFRALPFGLATAPFLFTWTLRPFLKVLRSFGVRIHAYLDDWIIHHVDKIVVINHLKLTIQLAAVMGFKVNIEKSQLFPVQTLKYLGIEFDLAHQMVRPPLDKCQAVNDLIQRMIKEGKTTASAWTSLLGKIGFIANMVPLGRLHTRELQLHLKEHWDFNWQRRNQIIPVTPAVIPALQWWLQIPVLRSGTALELPQHTLVLMTDACTEGWGAHLGNLSTMGRWPPECHQMHINELEMLAVTCAIKHFRKHLTRKTVLIATDNTTVIGHLRNQGGTKSPEMIYRTFEFFKIAESIGLSFICRHVPGRKNILADQLSRAGQVIHTEWTIKAETLDHLWTIWPRPQIDAFATCLNFRLPRYFSPVPDPEAEAVNAMVQDWTQESLYMFPPTPLLPAVLRKLHKPHAQVVLIVPWDQGAPWFPWLLNLSHQRNFQRVELPLDPDLLTQPLANDLRKDLNKLNLTACLLPRQHFSLESFRQ